MFWTIVFIFISISFVLGLIFAIAFIIFLKKEEYNTMTSNCFGCEDLRYCPDGTPYCVKSKEQICNKKKGDNDHA